MTQKYRTAFLVLVLLQALHSVEEYAFEFYEVFPPARILDGMWPGIAHPGFIVFNTMLVLFGLWCFFCRVAPGEATARRWAWIWVAIELYNGVAHPVWAVVARDYNPGLATAPLLFVVAALFARGLRADGRGALNESAV
ncbi:MAG: HXXEE domain-containing protein [bacterium]|nr:HXXEE domain-containing protein [bacterium]